MARLDPVFEAWRQSARRYLSDGVPPQAVCWTSPHEAQLGLFTTSATQVAAHPEPRGQGAHNTAGIHLPRALVQAMPAVAAHTDPGRWDTLYRLMWRIHHGERHVLRIAVDPDVTHFTRMLDAVRRDVHKMHAFVRFRQAKDGRFVSWYRPDHRIMRLATPHFVKRYPHMPWSIYTRDESAHWDTHALRFDVGCERQAVVAQDTTEDLWGVYYGAIFNPARLKLKAMRQEMPVRYWSVMPETRLISRLIREASGRVDAFYRAQPESARDYLPEDPNDWQALRRAAQACKACDFCAHATQTVFGSGPLQAPMALVGEQPGDEEDVRGEPFVGPAGQLLDQALGDAGIAREQLYLTNAVKHFKWEPRGKKRLHQRPLARDIAACKPWLAHEMAVVRPKVLVCLGATAAQAVFGRVTPVRDVRGQAWRTSVSEHTFVTTHPSHILRLQDPGDRSEAYARFVAELRMAHVALGDLSNAQLY